VLAVSGTIDGTADVDWELTFDIPNVLPSGTPTFKLRSQANSTSQVVRVEISWVAVARTTAYGTTKTSEGEQNITLSGTANTPVETSITLDATTVPAAGQRLEVNIRFHGTDAAWTANVKSLYKLSLGYV